MCIRDSPYPCRPTSCRPSRPTSCQSSACRASRTACARPAPSSLPQRRAYGDSPSLSRTSRGSS
eukprot:5955119-Alexandrium_andersonii.AAC.1